MRTATGPIRTLLWIGEAGSNRYRADAPELGAGGHYELRIAADGACATWGVGLSHHDAYGGQLGAFTIQPGRSAEECAALALNAIREHFTDAVETAIARMRGLR